MHTTHLTPHHARLGATLARACRLVPLVALVATISACGTGTPVGDEPVLEFLQTQAQEVGDVRHLDDTALAGTVSLAVRDNPRFTEVHFFVDDPARERAPAHVDADAPFTMDLDTRTLDDGAHNLTVLARVDRGRPSLVSQPFLVDNGAVDDAVDPGEPGTDGAPEGGVTEEGGDATEAVVPDEGTGEGADGEGGATTDGVTDEGSTDGAPAAPTEPDAGQDEPAEESTTPTEDPEPEPAPELEPAPEPEPEPASDLPAPTLFVSPHGDDGNDGRSASRPLRSVQRAADLVRAGDVVYLRGGVYPIDVRFSRSGTASAPIVWASYPGEQAIFDGSDQTPIWSSHKFRLSGASWNVFVGLEVRHGPQEGIFVENSHDNVFRDIVTHGHQYSGIGNLGSDRNLYEDILTYDNYDDHNPYGRYGDDADGIALSSGDSNVVRRVVAFDNSDDGIDAWRSTNTRIENVVAYRNGRGTHGNGNGIKAGGNSEWNHTVVRNSIAFHNKANGFDDNSGKGILFENNTAFHNGGYSFMGGSTTTRRNNIAVGGTVGMWNAQDSANSWDLGIHDPWFASTDSGSSTFLTLSAGSPAIGVGTGGADLGAIAYASSYADLLGPRLTARASLSGDTLALRTD